MSARIPIPPVHYMGVAASLDRLLEPLASHWAATGAVVLDFSPCRFISAEGVAVLAAFKLQRDTLGAETAVDWTTVKQPLKQLQRWKFNLLFGEPEFPWTDTAVPLLCQEHLDANAIVEYINRRIFTHAGMPDMTEPLAKATRVSFCEVFQNVFRHAESRIGGLAIGQLYPTRKEFQICVCDAGVGLVRRVQGGGFGLSSPCDAIAWALEQGHSTFGGKQPPGLGLYLLRNFVRANGGCFKIYANDGCLVEQGNAQVPSRLRNPLPGTLVELRLKVRDGITYTLA